MSTPFFDSSTGVYITPATPPNAARNYHELEALEVDGVQTPMSDYGNSGGSAHPPSFSDNSYDHRPEPLYILPNFIHYRTPPSPASPTSPTVHGMGIYLDSPLLSPEISTPLDINGRDLQFDPRPTLSPTFSLLSFPSCGPGFEEESERSPILSSPEEPGSECALFDGTASAPSFLFQSEASTDYSRSRTWSNTPTHNGLLMAPRRHSFASQRPRQDDDFFPPFESGASTPSTSYSSFPSSPYSEGSTSHLLAPATPELPSPRRRQLPSPRRRHVSSVAGVRASDRRRKHPGKFSCTEPECSQTFTTMHNYKNHLNAHAGVKPYACERPGCDGCFTTLSVKRRHERTCRGPPPTSTSSVA